MTGRRQRNPGQNNAGHPPPADAAQVAASPVVALQRAIGNRATSALVQRRLFSDILRDLDPPAAPRSPGFKELPPPPAPASDPTTEDLDLSEFPKPGDQGVDVAFLQVSIDDAMGAPGVLDPDGIFGSETRAMLMSLQRSNGLDPTGVVDQPTARIILDHEPEASDVAIDCAQTGAERAFDDGRRLRGEHLFQMGREAAVEAKRPDIEASSTYGLALTLHEERRRSEARKLYKRVIALGVNPQVENAKKQLASLDRGGPVLDVGVAPDPFLDVPDDQPSPT